MKPWLSVIIPVHDGARFLEATLASAAAERPDGVEFLLYDSSPDPAETHAIAEAFFQRLDLHWKATPTVQSWTAKTNLGAHEARADHICMLHQDDIWLTGHLAAIRAALSSDPDAAMSVAPSRFIDTAGRSMGSWRLPFRPGRIDGADFAAILLVQNSIAIPSPVIRRDAWVRAGGLNEQLWYTADWDFYLHLARQGYIFVRAAQTTGFRIHGSSLTMTGSRDQLAFRTQLEAVFRRHIETVPAQLRSRALRFAKTSIDVNCALAAVSAGSRRAIFSAIAAMVKLGPIALPTFLRQSRLVDRLVPRLQLTLAGKM